MFQIVFTTLEAPSKNARRSFALPFWWISLCLPLSLSLSRDLSSLLVLIRRGFFCQRPLLTPYRTEVSRNGTAGVHGNYNSERTVRCERSSAKETCSRTLRGIRWNISKTARGEKVKEIFYGNHAWDRGIRRELVGWIDLPKWNVRVSERGTINARWLPRRSCVDVWLEWIFRRVGWLVRFFSDSFRLACVFFFLYVCKWKANFSRGAETFYQYRPFFRLSFALFLIFFDEEKRFKNDSIFSSLAKFSKPILTL